MALYASYLVWDMTLPYDPGEADDVTLPRFKRAGVDCVSLTVSRRLRERRA